MAETEMMFVDDIAKMFHMNKNTVRRKKWREKNGIPLRKVGKRLCAVRTDVEKWFKGGLNG